MVDKSPEKIRLMFDKISDKYDFINNFMSLGTQIFIKKDCVKQLDEKSNAKILDLCCGTGDLTRILKEKYPNSEVFGVDFSEKMLEIARGKLVRQLGSEAANGSGKCKVKSGKLQSTPTFPYNNYFKADATNLPFKDNFFDIVTIGFGLRNIEDFDGAISEIYRVLEPGGYFLHLDFGKKNFLNKMFDKIIPLLVSFFTKNGDAYSYLIKSKFEFPEPNELIKIFEEKGFKLIKRKDYFLGAISCQIMKK